MVLPPFLVCKRLDSYLVRPWLEIQGGVCFDVGKRRGDELRRPCFARVQVKVQGAVEVPLPAVPQRPSSLGTGHGGGEGEGISAKGGNRRRKTTHGGEGAHRGRGGWNQRKGPQQNEENCDTYDAYEGV